MPERDSVDEMLRASLDSNVPAHVESRMRRQFADFRTRLETRRPTLGERAWSLTGLAAFRWAASAAVVATVLAIVFLGGGTDGGRVYAAAAARLAHARSVHYTIEIAPFVSVEVSALMPARQRIVMSWGMEVRSDGTGARLVLLHGSRQYVREVSDDRDMARAAEVIEQLRSLPQRADTVLGERRTNGRRLIGYRVAGARVPGQHGVESFDLWIDADSEALDHVDITPRDARGSGFQMHIRDIEVDATMDPSLFDMTPPPGYTDARTAVQTPR